MHLKRSLSLSSTTMSASFHRVFASNPSSNVVSEPMNLLAFVFSVIVIVYEIISLITFCSRRSFGISRLLTSSNVDQVSSTDAQEDDDESQVEVGRATRSEEERLRFDDLIEALVFREYEEEQVADVSFDLDASALSTFPALVSSSASFTDLSSVCSDSFAFSCSEASINDFHDSESFVLDTSILDILPSLLSSPSFDSNVGEVSNAWEDSDAIQFLAARSTSLERLRFNDLMEVLAVRKYEEQNPDVTFELDASTLATVPSLLSSSPSFDLNLADVSGTWEDANTMQLPKKRLRFSEFVDVLVFHEYEEEESFELDTSFFATFPSLLAPSPSLTALSSVSSDFDTFDCVASGSSASSHATTSINDESFDLDSSILDMFPSILSSPSFDSIDEVSGAWEDTSVIQPQVARTRPEKKLRFAEFVDVLVFDKYEEEEQDADASLSFELDTSALAIFPSLLNAPIPFFTALSSCCSDFDTFHTVPSSAFAYTIAVVGDSDGLRPPVTPTVANGRFLIAPSMSSVLDMSPSPLCFCPVSWMLR